MSRDTTEREVILTYTDEATGIELPYGMVPGDGRTLSRYAYPALYSALKVFTSSSDWLDLGGVEFDFHLS